MTIYLYTGTPGSGKSLHCARFIENKIRYQKKPVIANFRINPETKGFQNFTFVDNFDLTPEYLYDFAENYYSHHDFKGDGSINLILDEAQLIWNAREFTAKATKGADGQSLKNSRMDWVRFFSIHRHIGYENIILVTQQDRMIDRQIRLLAEYEVNHRRSNSFGLKGRILSLICFGEVFLAKYYNYGMKEPIQTELMKKRKRYFCMYDTHSIFLRVDDYNTALGNHISQEEARRIDAGFSGAPAEKRLASAKCDCKRAVNPNPYHLQKTLVLPPL